MPARAYLSLLLIGAAALGSLSACGSESASPGASLTVLAWEDYIPPDVLEDFQREFEIHVTVATFGTQHEVIDQLLAAPDQYDAVVVTGDIAGRLADLRLISPLDRSRVTNLRHVDPRFLGWSWDPSNEFTAPYDWGTTGLVYNTRVVERPTSWDVLDGADPARTAMDGDWLVVMGLALKNLGHELNSGDDGALDEAAALVSRRVAAGIPRLESVDLRNALASGELDLGMSYSGDAAWALERNPDLAFVIPDEGADLYVDVLAIPRGSRDQARANELVNFLLRPEIPAPCHRLHRLRQPERGSGRDRLRARWPARRDRGRRARPARALACARQPHARQLEPRVGDRRRSCTRALTFACLEFRDASSESARFCSDCLWSSASPP